MRLEQLRIAGPPRSNSGQFALGPLRFIVGDGGGWDHVSVSCANRMPTWDEMDRIKQLVFRDDEIVMQLHVNDDRKINQFKYCLHLWRPQTDAEIAAVRAAWTAAGETWPYDGLRSAGPVPLPPRDFV